MVSRKKAAELAQDCLRELYANSEPEGDWDKIKEKYADQEDAEFYKEHAISQEKYNEIVEKYRKKLGYYKRDLGWVLLDYAPTFKDNVQI